MQEKEPSRNTTIELGKNIKLNFHVLVSALTLTNKYTFEDFNNNMHLNEVNSEKNTSLIQVAVGIYRYTISPAIEAVGAD